MEIRIKRPTDRCNCQIQCDDRMAPHRPSCAIRGEPVARRSAWTSKGIGDFIWRFMYNEIYRKENEGATLEVLL